MKTLLILYVSAGAGHRRAAEALVATAQQLYPNLEVVCRDALDFMSLFVRRYYGRSYLAAANSTPELWGFMYDYSDRKGYDSRMTKLMRFLDRLQAKRLTAFVNKLQPAAIICTHFLPSNVLLSARGRATRAKKADRRGRIAPSLEPPISLVLTDFDVHSFCLHEDLNMYFVPSEEVKYQLLARGIRPEQTAVTGIPVLPAFAEYGMILSKPVGPTAGNGSRIAHLSPEADALKKTLREKLGVSPSVKVVLLLSGGFGVGHIEDTLRSLWQLDSNFQVLVVAGRNEKLQARLEKIAATKPGWAKVFGYVNNMHELMAASDVAVSKSGGLTVAECLAVGLPMVVMAPIPGQEVANCNYLVENGAAVIAKNVAVLRYKLERLLSDDRLLLAMRAKAASLAMPNAARQILALAIAAGK